MFAIYFFTVLFQYNYFLYLSDDMSPQVLFCPASFTILATRQKIVVKWKAPIFKDNSLGFIEPQCNRQSGDSFYWGDWNIYCRAHDNNPNNEPAVCDFVVTVKRKCHIGYLRAKDRFHVTSSNFKIQNESATNVFIIIRDLNLDLFRT